MEENSRFGFCPKCGAVSKDGVCQSCGTQTAGGTAGQQPYVQEGMQDIQAQGAGYPPQQAQGMASAGYPPQQAQGAGYPPQQAQGMAGAGYPPQQAQGMAGAGYPQQQIQGGAGYPQFYQPQNGSGQMPYGTGYLPQTYQACAAVPPAKPKKNKAAVVIYFICVAIVAVSLVFVILAAVGDIADKKDEDRDSGKSGRTETEQDADDLGEGEEEKPKESFTYHHHTEDVTERNWNEAGQDSSLPYYSGPYNAFRDDLSYELVFREETYRSDDVEVQLVVEYPQIISGDVPNYDYINQALRYDYDYFHNFFTEDVKPFMDRDSIFQVSIDSHVTYMDESILSVVFVERVRINLENDPFSMVNYFCMNFDLETGVLLEDTELLWLDENFAADFRRREAWENGEEALTNYSDEEILKMLKDPAYLVVFYTPMGMEVGLNLGNRVVYVTYEDYEQFLNTF